jgi:type IV secretory pathway TrbL component
LVAGALALSVSFAACTSSSGSSGMGGNTGVMTGTGGATTGTGGMTAGTGGVTGTGGMTTTTDGGPDTGTTNDPHTAHLNIINKATTGGVPVSRPAPAVSYSDCKI